MDTTEPSVVYWTSCETQNLNEEAIQNHLEKLSYTEQMRYDEIQDPQRSKQFLLGRILIWHLLKDAFEIKEYTIETQDTFDKPKLVFSQSDLELDFNISHTEHMVAAVITSSGYIGIDIEDMNIKRSWHGIGKKYFSAHENQDIERKPSRIKDELSLKLWVTKEAAIKARGQTISRGMADIKILKRWSEKQPFDVSGTHQNTQWLVYGITPMKDHFGAIALVKHNDKAPNPNLKYIKYQP